DPQRGDCVVAELERLKGELPCARGEQAHEALRFAVHFVGDIHQPLHALKEARGGNGVAVTVTWRGLTCGPRCAPKSIATNLHAAWDSNLITSTAWSWGAYVDRLELGWLASPQAQGVDGGSPADWAAASHAQAQIAWNMLPADHRLGDEYYERALPMVDRQLGLAGLRLARLLNQAYAAPSCAR
ncbi:MAG TPA: S1/P1 nuclease, partial [Burkholderiales bacterium]|nr:S1/P1 nuclease [Burkholderiales bacterium]